MDKIPNFRKSKIDKRDYRYLELSNSLRCLLISDNDVEQSAASLDVKVGSYSDPAEYPGLAHFCEHMLFVGTKKYPAESEYSLFIKDHGGDKNAYTRFMNTNYYFSVANASFSDALDRFSQFFKEPLFTPDLVARETNAVDSEQKKNLSSDYRRYHQLMMNLANPASVVNRFCSGSKETLDKPGVRESLVKFHTAHYSANLMTLVLLGKHPLDTLEKMAKEHFEGIANKNATILDATAVLPFDKTRLGKFIKIVPVGSKNILRVMWAFPDTRKLYKTKPAHYMAHLLGHEGPNSLLSYLIDEGLALSLTSYADSLEAGTDFLSAEIELTEKGLGQHEQVVEIVCAFAKMIREKGPQKYVSDELIQMEKLRFDYISQSEPYETARALASTMHDYPREIVQDVLSGPYVTTEFDPEMLRKLIDLMTPENMIVILSSKECKSEATLEERWFKTQYGASDFSPAQMAKFTHPKAGPSCHGKVIDLPPPNILIPSNVTLLPMAADLPKTPKLVKEESGTSLWYLQDHKFGVPKAYGNCRIWTSDNGFPVLDESQIFVNLFLRIFFEEIREFMYMAELAGMNCGLNMLANRINLSFSGFNESLPVLVDSFLKKMKEFQPEKHAEKFEIKRMQEIKSQESIMKETPYLQCMDDYAVALSSFSENHCRKLELLKGFTFSKFVHYAKHWLHTTRMEWLIAGNLTEQTAVKVATSAEAFLSQSTMPKERIVRSRTVQLPLHSEHVLIQPLSNVEEANSCLVSYFQFGAYLDSELHLWALNEVALDFISEEAFAELRTKQQLGYVVDVRATVHNRVLGGRFLIQSDKMAPERLHARVNAFLDVMKLRVEKMTDEEFKLHVEAICVALRQQPISLAEEFSNHWHEIGGSEYMFDRNERMVKILEGLKKSDAINYFKNLFFNDARRYDFEMVCKKHEAENDAARAENVAAASKRGNKRVYVDSAAELRATNYLFPDIYLLNSQITK